MECVKEFMDTSTIHGLSRISSTKRFARFFWILIVIVGLFGAGCLIYESWYNWGQSPITTTIENLPISKITFPNVTVCPPKNLFLNLHHDIEKSENVKLDTNTRKEFFELALDEIQDEFYKEIMTNLSKLEDPDRYYNWYHGYTQIKYPQIKNLKHLYFYVSTSATSGNISTQYFDERFDAEKVDGNLYVNMNVYYPSSVRADQNTTIMFNINKKTMKEFSDDDLFYMDVFGGYVDAELTHLTKKITAPDEKLGRYYMRMNREVSADDISHMDLDMMPGFRLTWNYNKHVEAENTYSKSDRTKEFVRYIL